MPKAFTLDVNAAGGAGASTDLTVGGTFSPGLTKTLISTPEQDWHGGVTIQISADDSHWDYAQSIDAGGRSALSFQQEAIYIRTFWGGRQDGDTTPSVQCIVETEPAGAAASSTLGTASNPEYVIADFEGQRPTYSVAVAEITPAAGGCTDLFTLEGGANIIRIVRIEVSGVCDAAFAQTLPLALFKRTARNTGGAQLYPLPVVHYQVLNPNGTALNGDGLPTGSPVQYTSNPEAIGAGRRLRAGRLLLPPAGSASSAAQQPELLVWEFGVKNDRALFLRGAAQVLALNLDGRSVPAGTRLNIALTWTEDQTESSSD